VAIVPGLSEGKFASLFGTIATCTTQGFFIYVTGFISIFYYGSFSIYSYVGVLNNFKKSKIIWVEKYIYILVYFYPLISGFYILSQKGFNDSGYGVCSMSSSPLGCWLDPTSIPCERGPESRLTVLFRIIPEVLALILPTIVMVVLFVRVRKCQENIFIDAQSIAKQGIVYLVVLYWTILPFLIGTLLGRLDFKGIINSQFLHPYYIAIQMNFSIFALWAMLSYFYFSVEKKTTSTKATGNDNSSKRNATEITLENEMNTLDTSKHHDYIFTSQEFAIQDTTPMPTPATVTEKSTQQPRYSFNIFDGTGASGAFASFIHDGDSDDEKVDNAATEHWAAVQGHI